MAFQRVCVKPAMHCNQDACCMYAKVQGCLKRDATSPKVTQTLLPDLLGFHLPQFGITYPTCLPVCRKAFKREPPSEGWCRSLHN